MPTKPVSDAVLARAAELRAEGNDWNAVARKMSRSPNSVRGWPGLYPARWEAALNAAERRLVAETSAESVLVLRNLLRSKDEKVRRDAAKLLIDFRTGRGDPPVSTSAEPTSDRARFVAFLETHDYEQLLALDAALHGPEPAPRAPDAPHEVAGAD